MTIARQTEIVVVGAGLAGLCAARSLTQRGHDVLVLEARSRMGGRLAPVLLGGRVAADLGGQWLGPGQERIIRLAAELGIQSYKTHTTGRASYQLLGAAGSYRGIGPASHLLGLVGASWGARKLSRLARQVAAQTARNAWPAALHNQSVGDWIEARVWPETARHLLRFMLQALFCCDPADVSLLLALQWLERCDSLQHMLGIDGGCQERQLSGGTQRLLERLSDPLTSRILLDTPVRRLEHDASGALVSGDRFEVRARRVVLTAPPQLVAEIDFTPTLPSARKRTLSQLKMGAVVKSALLYERPFWRDQGLSGEMWSDLGPLTGTYDTTEPGCAQGLLTGLATGPHAAALGAMTAEARRQHILAGLVPHFGERAASPLEYRDQVWSAEVWTRGGYAAHLGAGQFTPAYRSLHEPVGVLHWAGTETAAAWPGYMEGAIESSERVVRELTSTVA